MSLNPIMRPQRYKLEKRKHDEKEDGPEPGVQSAVSVFPSEDAVEDVSGYHQVYWKSANIRQSFYACEHVVCFYFYGACIKRLNPLPFRVKRDKCAKWKNHDVAGDDEEEGEE